MPPPASANTALVLIVARIGLDDRYHASLFYDRFVPAAVKAGVKGKVRTGNAKTQCCEQLTHTGHRLRQEPGVIDADRLNNQRRDDIAPIVGYVDDFFTALVLVAGISDFAAPFFATVLLPSPCSAVRSSFPFSFNQASEAVKMRW